MKKLFQFILSLFALFSAVIGVLIAVDSLVNKNRMKGEYLPCDFDTDYGSCTKQP